jgi:hypothetical protein
MKDPALKGRQIFFPGLSSAIGLHEYRLDRPYRAGRFFWQYLGLKPQAESCYPFGIKTPTGPVKAPPTQSPLTNQQSPSRQPYALLGIIPFCRA